MDEKTNNIISICILLVLIIIFIILLLFTSDSKKIITIQDFIKTDTKVLYISLNQKDDYIKNILNRYEINYLNIDKSTLTIFEIKKIKELVNNDLQKNLIVIYKNGVILDILFDCEQEKTVNEFLQKNNIIPKVLDDKVENIMKEATSILDNDYLMLYIPYIEGDDIKNQDEIFKDLANRYNIPYKMINATLLSETQHEKINKILGISSVEDQIFVLIKNYKVVANIRGKHSKNTYKEELYKNDFIIDLKDKIEYIDYDEFKDVLKEDKKNIILINDEKSDSFINLLNKMIYSYDLEIKCINVSKEESVIYNKVKEKIENIGYDGAYSLPIVIILESNKVLEYVIGDTTEEYLLDIFIENGIIKGAVIDE